MLHIAQPAPSYEHLSTEVSKAITIKDVDIFDDRCLTASDLTLYLFRPTPTELNTFHLS